MSFDLAVSGRGREGGASSGRACSLVLGLWSLGSGLWRRQASTVRTMGSRFHLWGLWLEAVCH